MSERSPSPRKRSRSRSRSRGRTVKGTVARWNDRGFGFVSPEDGGEDVFCHFSQIKDGNCLKEGDPVEYECVYDDRRGKDRCENLTGGFHDDKPFGGGGVGECFAWRDGMCDRGDSCKFSHAGPGGSGGGRGRDDDRGRGGGYDRGGYDRGGYDRRDDRGYDRGRGGGYDRRDDYDRGRGGGYDRRDDYDRGRDYDRRDDYRGRDDGYDRGRGGY